MRTIFLVAMMATACGNPNTVSGSRGFEVREARIFPVTTGGECDARYLNIQMWNHESPSVGRLVAITRHVEEDKVVMGTSEVGFRPSADFASLAWTEWLPDGGMDFFVASKGSITLDRVDSSGAAGTFAVTLEPAFPGLRGEPSELRGTFDVPGSACP